MNKQKVEIYEMKKEEVENLAEMKKKAENLAKVLAQMKEMNVILESRCKKLDEELGKEIVVKKPIEAIDFDNKIKVDI